MELNLLKKSSFLSTLNWNEIIEQLSSYLYFQANIKKIEQTPFLHGQDEIEADYDFIEKLTAEQNLDNFTQQIFQTIPPNILFHHTLHKLKKASCLMGEEINWILQYVETYNTFFLKNSFLVKNRFSRFDIDANTLDRFKQQVLKPTRKFISPEGEIDYLKHPILSPIFKDVLKIQATLRSKIREIIGTHAKNSVLQSDQYDIVSGHYVIAIRSDSYQNRFGVIIGRSQSNQTLYVEPPEIRAINYSLLEIESHLEKETYKVLGILTQLIADFLPLLWPIYKNILQLDYLIAKSRYCEQYALSRPEIIADNSLVINNFFHPLITDPIKNSICLSSDHSGLVISGPNTGGKTVALKSIALCTMFMHMGLFVPATDAQIPLYDGIYFFANDHQDILEGLSSFAAETKNYLTLLNTLQENNIIFIDEVFNSTSSEEASALALSLIDKILEIKPSKIFISSHHYSFKTLMQMKKSFLNAHVGLNHNQTTPTYKLHIGSPGSSMALQIFQKLSEKSTFAKDLVVEAQKYLQQDQIKYEKLLSELSTQEGILYQEREEIKKIKKELEEQRSSAKHLIKLEKEHKIQLFEKKFDRIIKEGEKIISQVKKGEISSSKTLHLKSIVLKKEFADEKPAPKAKSENMQLMSINAVNIKVDHSYYCTKSENMVKVISISAKKNIATVMHKHFKFTTSLETLFINQDKAKQAQTETQSFYLNSSPLSIEVKCLGMRLEEFKDTVEQYITALQLEEIPYAIITHGNGDGVLKNWLRKSLKHRREFQWSNIDGNDGQTRIELSPT